MAKNTIKRKKIIEINASGELLSTLIETWAVLYSIKISTFFEDGTYKEFNMYAPTADFTTGKIDIVYATTAKLLQELPEGFGYIPSYSELIYDPVSDKIYIGGTRNEGYSKVE